MKKHKKKKAHAKKSAERFPHNPDYCMIYPSADDRDDGIVSAGKS